MGSLTKDQVLAEFNNAEDKALFCSSCYETLVQSAEGTLYCPNDMCMSEQEYDSEGKKIE